MILGIDLGTSNSMAAVYKDGKPVLIKSSTGRFAIPSVVNIDEKGVFYMGDVAKERKLNHPNETVDMFKRSMGTDELFEIGDRKMKAEELSAVVLKGIKEDAEHFLGERITDAVISVPAFFTNPQRKAVIRAGELAGFNVRKIINEPTAAAMAYGIQNIGNEDEKVIIVLDLGGGTFDISVMEVSDKVMEVVAICGDNKLGGGDFTRRLIDIFLNENGIKQQLSVEESTRLWKVAENAKIKLGANGEAEMNCIIAGKDYNLKISEEEYENACFDLLERIRKLTLQAIAESKYESQEIEEIIMVGGGTKLSIVRKMMERMMGKTLEYKINPDEAVTMGAAMQGAFLEKDESVSELVMTDICPYFVGIDVVACNGLDFRHELEVLIEKNTTIPAKKTTVYESIRGLVTSKVCQSADRYGRDSVVVGEMQYYVPDMISKYTEVNRSLIYDANGIIHYEINIPAINKTYRSSFASDGHDIDEMQSFEENQNLDIRSRDDDVNEIVLARAERVYSECTGNEREMISDKISEFETVLNAGKITPIKRVRKELIQLLDMYDMDVLI